MIAKVILWSNGNVMVFNAASKQMAAYQGPLADVIDRILADAPEDAVFEVGSWNVGTLAMTRAAFAAWKGQLREAQR